MLRTRLLLTTSLSATLLMGCGTEIIPVTTEARPNTPMLGEPGADGGEGEPAASSASASGGGTIGVGTPNGNGLDDGAQTGGVTGASPALAINQGNADAGQGNAGAGAAPATNQGAADAASATTDGDAPDAESPAIGKVTDAGAAASSADATTPTPVTQDAAPGAGHRCAKPDLSPSADDFESFAAGDNPLSAAKYSHGDLVRVVSTPGQAPPSPGVARASSGSKSVLFFDDAADEAPELRSAFPAAARGVFQARMYVVPEATSRRDTVFTVYGDQTSDAGRITAFRLRSNGTLSRRITVDGAHLWIDITGASFPPNTWVNVELAWDLQAGCETIWFSANDTLVMLDDPFQDKLAQTVGIRVGDNAGTDSTAATFIDDFGVATATE